MSDAKSKGEEFAKAFEDFVNTYSENRLREAAKACQNAHRYGQNQMMRFFLMFCEEMGKNADEGRYDERNRKACMIAQNIRDQHSPNNLPR